MGDGNTASNHVPEEVVGITGALEVDLGRCQLQDLVTKPSRLGDHIKW